MLARCSPQIPASPYRSNDAVPPQLKHQSIQCQTKYWMHCHLFINKFFEKHFSLKNKLSKRLLAIKIIDGQLSEDEKIYNNNVEIGKVLIDKNYPFALIKYLDKNFNKDQIIKSKTCSFKILIPDWLKI